MVKKTLIFAVIYVVLSIVGIIFIFAWNSFGGSNSTNYFQKAVTFFFSFPANTLGLNQLHFVFQLLINATFWSLVFFIILYIKQQMFKF